MIETFSYLTDLEKNISESVTRIFGERLFCFFSFSSFGLLHSGKRHGFVSFQIWLQNDSWRCV